MFEKHPSKDDSGDSPKQPDPGSPENVPKFHVFLTSQGRLLIKDDQNIEYGEAASVEDCYVRLRALGVSPTAWIRFYAPSGTPFYESPLG